MSAFLQCASNHPLIEAQDGFVENNSQDVQSEGQPVHLVNATDAEN
jgi:hypothetical protein